MSGVESTKWSIGNPLRAAAANAERAAEQASDSLIKKALLISPIDAQDLPLDEWSRRNSANKFLIGVAAVAPIAAGGLALGIPGAISFGVANAIMPHMAMGRFMIMAVLGAGAGIAQASRLAFRSTRAIDGIAQRMNRRREEDGAAPQKPPAAPK